MSDDGRCPECRSEVDHYLGCSLDPNPDYEAEAEAQREHAEALDVIAWHRALTAAFQAQRDFRAERLGNPEWDSDWDDEAEAIVEAVWPHIAAHERAEGAAAERERADNEIADARYQGRTDGEKVGAERERARIRALSTETGATYRTGWNGSRHFAPFADLMDREPS